MDVFSFHDIIDFQFEFVFNGFKILGRNFIIGIKIELIRLYCDFTKAESNGV